MTQPRNLSKLNTSWTKYSIVQVLDVLKSKDILNAYLNGEEGITIDKANLKSFLGIKNTHDEIPGFWQKLYNYPQEKMLFGMMALILTHHKIIKAFIEFSSGAMDMKGIFICDEEKNKIITYKEQTNARSALVESGASSSEYRRASNIPYNFSAVFQNPELGPLFKELIINRLIRCGWMEEEIEHNMPQICRENKIAEAFNVESDFFQTWLNGVKPGNYIQKLNISDFIAMNNILMDFSNSKEIYFLGENGDGKTLLLMALFLAFRKGYLDQQEEIGDFAKILDIFRKNPSFEISGNDEQGRIYSTKNKAYLPRIYAYGPQRARTDVETADPYGFRTLFNSYFNNDIPLISPEAWLKDLKGTESARDLMSSTQASTLEIKILDSDGNSMSSQYTSRDIRSLISTRVLGQVLSDILEKNITITWDVIEPKFKEHGSYLSFDSLSEGYKSIIIFVVDLIYRLVHDDNDDDEKTNVLDKKAVVLVDEIELHIHPRWQMNLVKKLRNNFPNIQFFFTTHSPTIIQAASNEAIIYRVYRENGTTFVSTPHERKSLNRFTINTLATSSLFDLESARMDSETDDYTTSETYALDRLNTRLKYTLQKQHEQGKKFLTDNDIDNIIDSILQEYV